MACNCKKNVNKRYVDNEFGLEEVHKITKFSKGINIVLQFLFGLLFSAIFIVALIPFCGYIIFSVCTGSEMMVKIPNFTKWFKK